MSATFSITSFINQYPYAIVALVFIFLLGFMIFIYARNRKEKQSQNSQNIIINNAPQSNQEQQGQGGQENRDIREMPEEAVQRLFGLKRKIKNAIIGTAIAIPLLIVAYIVGQYYALIAFPLLLMILYYAAKKWVNPEGVRLILDGDIEPGNPLAGVMHVDYKIPYQQWNLLTVSSIGGAYPIQTQDGLAYRITRIEFWDPEETIVKEVELAWLHANDSNFENDHLLFHKVVEWLKVLLRLETAYENLIEVISIQEARDITSARQEARRVAISSPTKANERIADILGQIDKLKIEAKKIEKSIPQTSRKPWIENRENNAEQGGGGNSAGEQ